MEVLHPSLEFIEEFIKDHARLVLKEPQPEILGLITVHVACLHTASRRYRGGIFPT
jgi:hypothetical protein